MATDTEKENEVQIEDASSGEVAPRAEVPPTYDEMNWQAFMAVVVSSPPIRSKSIKLTN